MLDTLRRDGKPVRSIRKNTEQLTENELRTVLESLEPLVGTLVHTCATDNGIIKLLITGTDPLSDDRLRQILDCASSRWGVSSLETATAPPDTKPA